MSNYAEDLGRIGNFLDNLINSHHVPTELARKIDQKLAEVVDHIDLLAIRAKEAKKVADLMPYIETLVASVKDLQRRPK